MSSQPTPTITLYRGFPARATYTPSPFVNKLEARLRLGKLSYKTEEGSPLSAPRGKIPYVEVQQPAGNSSSTEKLADSTLIAQRLVADGHLADLNAGLSPAARARDLSVRALLEDRLYFFHVRERWVDNYHAMRDTVLAALPYPVRVVVGLLAYRDVAKTLQGQGVLRYSAEEAAALRREVWESVGAMLAEARGKVREDDGGEPFWVLGGETPTEADAVVFGFVAASLGSKMAPETDGILRSLPVVVDYARRIHSRYFENYEGWQD